MKFYKILTCAPGFIDKEESTDSKHNQTLSLISHDSWPLLGFSGLIILTLVANHIPPMTHGPHLAEPPPAAPTAAELRDPYRSSNVFKYENKVTPSSSKRLSPPLEDRRVQRPCLVTFTSWMQMSLYVTRSSLDVPGLFFFFRAIGASKQLCVRALAAVHGDHHSWSTHTRWGWVSYLGLSKVSGVFVMFSFCAAGRPKASWRWSQNKLQRDGAAPQTESQQQLRCVLLSL